jgi:hypothetical protein
MLSAILVMQWLSSAEASYVLTFIASCAYQSRSTPPNHHRSKNCIHSPPPGAQGNQERWSLVFFTRPGNSVVLRALTEDSKMVAEAVKKNPGTNFEPGSTSYEWFTRRIKNQRIKNRKVGISIVKWRWNGCVDINSGTGDVGGEPWDGG